MRIHEFVDEVLGHTSSMIDLGRNRACPGAVNVVFGAVAGAAVAFGPLTVMRGHGERAITGASILAASGHDHVLVLDGGPDTWSTTTGETLETTR